MKGNGVECELCEVWFTYERDLRVHYLRSSFMVHPKCGLCNVGFKDQLAQDKHMILVHWFNGCKQCYRLFSRAQGQQHYENCPLTSPGMTRTGQPVLEEHFQPPKDIPRIQAPKGKKEKKEKKEKKQPGWRCELCNIGFSKLKALRQHSLVTPSHPCCTICNMGFPSATHYKKHTAKVHSTSQSKPQLSLGSLPHSIPDVPDQPLASSRIQMSMGLLVDPVQVAEGIQCSPSSASATVSASVTSPTTTPAHGGPAIQHRCLICNLTFSSEDEASTHYKTSPVHPSCARCEDSFHDKGELSRHLQAVHGCIFCSCGVIVELDRAAAHYKASSCHPECSDCGAAFKDAPALLEHQISAHSDQCCLRCDRWYPTKPDLHRHLFECFPAAPPRCMKCKQAFPRNADYLEHLVAVHDSPEMPAEPAIKNDVDSRSPREDQQKKVELHRCDHCNLGFATELALKEHNLETPLHPRCILCQKGFLVYEGYVSHMVAIHPSSKLRPPLLPLSPSPTTHAASQPKVVLGGDCLQGSTAESQLPANAPAMRTAIPATVIHDLQAADNAGLSSETGRNSGNLTQAMLERGHPAKFNLETDTGSVIQLDSSSTRASSEAGVLVAQQARPHPSNTAVQCEDADEREEEASSDACDDIHADERSTDANARVIQERPDSVISYYSETDADSAVLPASSSARPSDSTVTQVSSSNNTTQVMDTRQVDYPKDTVSQSCVSAPPSDACTRGLSTRLESIDISMESASRPAASPSLIASDTSADAPPVSTGRTRGSTSSRSRMSEDASSTKRPTPSPSKSTAGALHQGRSADPGLSWHCRGCGKDPCEDPTATQCGHIFCYKCIVKEIAKSMKCPVCNKLFLLRLQAS